MKKPEDEILKYIDDNMEIQDGMVVWKQDKSGKNRKKGMPVGQCFERSNGSTYKTTGITLHGRSNILMVNRIAWYLYTGDWPERGIVMINGDPNDFSIENLAHQNPRYINVVKRFRNSIANPTEPPKSHNRYHIRYIDFNNDPTKKRYKGFKNLSDAMAFRMNYYHEALEYYSSQGLVTLNEVLLKNS